MIRFSKYIWVYLLLSAFVLVPGVFSLIRFGLRPSIDFTGGTLLELRFSSPVNQSVIVSTLQKESIQTTSIQPSTNNTYLLRIKPESSEKVTKFISSLAAETKQEPGILRNETVGPILGKELLDKTVVAGILSIITILAFVAYAFQNIRFGVAAIIALVHDFFVVLGIFSLLGLFKGVEVDTLFVTAVLTTMSFSVHDTIVVFDRIREYTRKGESSSFEALCDRALTETMGRSTATSITIIFMLFALVLMGGESIKWFVLALLVGTISGVYSSPFIATPMLVLWHRWEERKKRK